MTDNCLQIILSQACNELGIKLSAIQKKQMITYANELNKWNKTYNLTAVKDDKGIMKRHIIDALSVYHYVKSLSPKTIADIGSGAGIPGIVLSIMFPEVEIDLVESIGKKCRFLRHVISSINLYNINVQQKRVEEWHPNNYKSILICRAFTSLKNFITITEHLGDKETFWLAMKSARTKDEEALIPSEYLTIENCLLKVPFEKAKRHLLVLKHK